MGMFDWVDEVVNNVMSADTEIGISISSAPDLASKQAAISAAISTQPMDITANIEAVLPFDISGTLTAENTNGIFNPARDILNAIGTAEGLPSNFDQAIDMANSIANDISDGTSINDVTISGEYGGIQFDVDVAAAIDGMQAFMNDPSSAVSDLSASFSTGIENITDPNLKTILKFMGDANIDELSSLSSPETLNSLNICSDIASAVGMQKGFMQEIFDDSLLPSTDPNKMTSGELMGKSDSVNSISCDVAGFQLSVSW